VQSSSVLHFTPGLPDAPVLPAIRELEVPALPPAPALASAPPPPLFDVFTLPAPESPALEIAGLQVFVVAQLVKLSPLHAVALAINTPSVPANIDHALMDIVLLYVEDRVSRTR
jgi:hypothetical protein